MINYEYEYLFKQTSIPKQLKIYYSNGALTNQELEYEKFELHESLCSAEQLQFNSFGASYIKFSVGYGIVPLDGEEIVVTTTPEDGTEFTIGHFKVTSDTPTADRRHRDIVAYDKMYDIFNTELIDWYNSVFPTDSTTVTVRQFRNSLFDYLGVQQNYRNISGVPLDNVLLRKTVYAESLSGKEVVTALCEMNMVFGHINPQGQFEYVYLMPIGETLFPDEELYPAEDLYPAEGDVDEEVGENGNYISATFEDYYTEPIDKFVVRMSENDVGYISGTGTNAYIIQNNFLLYGKSTQELDDIYGGLLNLYLGKIFFTPADIVAQGNPCLQVGDRIRLRTKYATIDTYIFQRSLTGIQGLRDTYFSESPRLREEQLNSVNHSLMLLRGKSNTLERTIEETRIEVSDLEVGLTEVTIKADGLEIQVEDIERQIEGETLFFERESGAPTLTNYPAYDFTKSIPCDGTMQLGEGIPFRYDAGYNTYSEHSRDLCVDLSTGEGYRFLLQNGNWIWKAIEGSDWSVLYNQIADLRVDVDSIDLEVSNTEVTVQDHETRITNNTASINTQASQISAKVNQSDHNASNTFGWDLTTAGFDVKSNGTSVFKVDSTGAEVKGKITSQSGQIANMQITTTGFTYGNNAGIRPSGSYGNNEIDVYGNGVKITDTTNATPRTCFSCGYGQGETKISGGSIIEIIPHSGLYVESETITSGLDNGVLTSWFSNETEFFQPVYCVKSMIVQGTKSREVNAEGYGKRLLYCLETPSPMFEDIGEGKIAEDGKCYINIDSTFSRTIQTTQYQVFLQSYGNGNVYVSERHSTYFVVEGTVDLSFGWRIVAKQFDYPNTRLEKNFGSADMSRTNYSTEGFNHYEHINRERQVK